MTPLISDLPVKSTIRLKIPNEDFQCVLEAGRLSPSSFGFEPWKFLVVDDPGLREAIRCVAWGAHYVVVLARKPVAISPDSEYISKTIMLYTYKLPDDIKEMRSKKYGEFLDTDFAYTGNDRAGFELAARQCYITVGNMMTVAAMLGIDSCGCEGFHKEKLETLLAERGVLDRETFGVACMVSFGYRKEPPKHPKTRRPAESVVQFI